MNPEELAKLQAMTAGTATEDMVPQENPNPEGQEINTPDDTLTPEEEYALIQKAMRRFNRASAGMDEHHKAWNIIDKFDRGKQWDNVQIPVWIPKPITNLIRYVRTTKRANLAQNVPQANFTPLTPNDEELVYKIQKAYEHVWDEQKIPLMIRKVVDRALLHGTSIVYVYADDNIRGKYYGDYHKDNQLYRYDVKVKKLNNANFYIDPTAYCIAEAKFATVTEPIAFSDVKNHPIFKEFAGEKLKNLKFADLQRNSNANGDIFDRPVTKEDSSHDADTDDEMCTMHIHWERYRNEEGSWQVDVSYFLWNTDFLLYRIEDFKPSVLPFAVYYDEEEENSFWGTSTAMDMLENQKIVNKTAQAASIIGTLHQNPQKVVLRESGINAAEMSRTGTLAGKVWTSNVPNAVETIQPPDIPKGLFDIEDRMKGDIKEMAGITEAYNGESVGSLTTSTGVDSLIDRSTIRDRDKSSGQIDPFVEDLSELIANFILVYWQEERPIMTRRKNGSAEYMTWTPVSELDYNNMQWRIRSDVYAHAPITAASKSQQADALMQQQGQFQHDPPIITPEEWINMKDFPDKEDILLRMQADRENKKSQDIQGLTDKILQLIQQAQQLKGQGVTDQHITEQMAEPVKQIVEQTFTSGTKQGTAGEMGSMAPKGTTSPTAMGNMTAG